jgi:uncharacterized protein (DUF4213/DUF364 family)
MVIIILAIILIIALPKVTVLFEESRIKAFHRDEDIMVNSCRNYLSKNSSLLPKEIGDVIIVSYSTLVNNNYLEKIRDPKSKEPCLDISKVIVKKQMKISIIIYQL